MQRKIVIAGGGIAGLAAALALALRGISSTIIEAAPKPAEVGAGIQVPPNACHVMAQLGLLDALAQKAIAPQSIDLADAVSGKRVLSLPVNTAQSDQFFTVHRATLHGVLYAAAKANSHITLLEGHRITNTASAADSVTVKAQGPTDSIDMTAHLLIGADGVWSQTRQAIKGAAAPAMTGRIALRAVVPATQSTSSQRRVTAWMAPNAHMVSYPVRNGDTENLVAITKGRADKQSWAATASDQTIAHMAKAFANTPYERHFATTQWTIWPLAQVPQSAPWDNGTTIVLIGDAAHAIEPFAAQGAAMALEDALTLANAIASNPTTQSAIAAYTSQRKARIAKVAARTAFNRTVYHLGNPARLARNAAFQLRSPASFLKDLDWLYGFRA